MTDILTQGLNALSLPTDAAPVLARYGSLLLEKNRTMNLTAITDPAQVAQLHMLDCAALLGCADFKGKKMLDVGTGAGFPGMVLALTEPSIDLTLLDSLNKRIDWLREIAPALGVSHLTALHGRAEEFGLMPEYREQFDLVTSRAVADLRILCELCLPFVKPGGLFLAMKGQKAQEEKDAAGRCISILGGRLKKDYVYQIPGTDITHRVVVVEKVNETPGQYPRRFAKIKKAPL
ncbi:MAG: 16S rRNA (guanine(527)-N(7))-methyltransferase RsmG [Oscillospiraceae bacterium]|nr:16S rRNA (guanine(527)-N(7))-methyltransferase RsmG [Oscillospiraceae bacterium]